MTLLDVRPDLSGSDLGDEPLHLVCCCSPSIGLCGADLGEDEAVEYEQQDEDYCDRCDDLASHVCILCGYGNYGPCQCGNCPR